MFSQITSGQTSSFIEHPVAAHYLYPLIEDFDNDGDWDLPHLRNDGNLTFVLQGPLETTGPTGFHGIAAYDFDEDGWQDIIAAPYIVKPSAGTPIHVWRNQQNWQFERILTDYFGALLNFNDQSSWRSETIITADLNHDDLKDIYIPFYTFDNDPTQSVLLIRQRDGSFTEEAVQRGLALENTPLERRPEGAQLADIDQDGDLDVYVSGRLFENNSTGYFTDKTADWGLPNLFDEGAQFLDYNNDGLLDLYLRVADHQQLLWQNKGTYFENTTIASGLYDIVKDDFFYWGGSWADFDSDGDLDLFFNVGTDWIENPQTGGYRLIFNNGDGIFSAGLYERTLTHTSVPADFDMDGDLDLFICCTVDGVSKILENILPQQGTLISYAAVDEQGERIYGATVFLYSCGITQTRVAGAPGVYLAQPPFDAYFGLPTGCTDYQIEVVAPLIRQVHQLWLPVINK